MVWTKEADKDTAIKNLPLDWRDITIQLHRKKENEIHLEK